MQGGEPGWGGRRRRRRKTGSWAAGSRQHSQQAADSRQAAAAGQGSPCAGPRTMYWLVPVPLLYRCTAPAHASPSMAVWQATRARAQLGTVCGTAGARRVPRQQTTASLPALAACPTQRPLACLAPRLCCGQRASACLSCRCHPSPAHLRREQRQQAPVQHLVGGLQHRQAGIQQVPVIIRAQLACLHVGRQGRAV